MEKTPTRPRTRVILPPPSTTWALYQDSGRSKEAGAAFREALAIRKNLVAKHPDAPEYQTKLATSYYNYYNLGIR